MIPPVAGMPPVGVPEGGRIASMVLALAATTILTLFITQRALAIRSWRRLPLVVWLMFAIYVDSYLFVTGTATLQHALGINANHKTCDSAILLCLACYITTKIFIYLFLVEKSHIVRATPKGRLQSRLYLFNSCGMLGIYVVVAIPNFIFRIADLKDGHCIIGMRSPAMIPLISFDAIANVYLTLMFLVPLSRLYSFKNMARTPANRRLRTVAVRTFIGAICTLISSIVQVSSPLAVCVRDTDTSCQQPLCANGVKRRARLVLFSALVIQWVTSRDNAGSTPSTSSSSHRAAVPPDCISPSSIRLTTPCDYSRRSLITVDDISVLSSPRPSFSRDCPTDGPGDPEAPPEAIPMTRIRRETDPSIPSAYDRKARKSGEVRFADHPPPLKSSCGPFAPESYCFPRVAATGTTQVQPSPDVDPKSNHSFPNP
ncbi:hypothetical protein PCL_09186 [Purpureocillium lilacinum]|uniref:Uncharacterized protein n=1 Tax=Purpureocillium lilacinum TaxID=33203 RepID=A0A2U3EHJ1_PURLI|nr:hypothetical protein PCL_09186 [Purpureocillium lilacinum]